jgi:hypothetical protein
MDVQKAVASAVRPTVALGAAVGLGTALAVVLLWCLVSFAIAPAALAAGGGGISGVVTTASSHEPLPRIEVTAYEAAGHELPVGFATTKASGEYTIAGLPSGSYKVEFSAGFGGEGGNYIPQYFEGASSSAQAKPVLVGDATVAGIDAQMQVGGEIEGTVTEANPAGGSVPLKGISVVVLPSDSEQPVGFATTEADGHYTVMGLPGGSYRVEFSPGFEGEGEPEPLGVEGEEFPVLKRRDLIGQFYKDAPSLAAATAVPVVQEEAAEGIDAELQRGAEIEGTVTDAATHAPLADAFVVAYEAGKVPVGTAFTDASGHYAIVGLPSGSYTLGFAAARHISQFYNDEPTFASASPIAVVAPSTVANIDAALVPKAPVNTAAPVLSGTPAVGETLACAAGTWTGSPAPVYSYAWLRDGVAIAGATASSYTVQGADEGNGLTCKVTATNKSGSASALSNTLVVPVPTPPPPAPTVSLSSTKFFAHGRTVGVRVTCAHASCIGSVELTELVTRHGRHHAHAKRVPIVLGRGSYSLTAGHTATVLVRLNTSGAHALPPAPHRLAVTVNVSVSGGATVSAPAVLATAKPAPHRRR